jgi:hypothetical protein
MRTGLHVVPTQAFCVAFEPLSAQAETAEFDMKRFLCIYRGTPAQPAGADQATVVTLLEEMSRAGALLAAEQCVDSSNGVRLRAVSGDVVVGKQPQIRECTSGVILMQLRSLDDAVEWNTRIMQMFRDGECEICELANPPGV